MTILVTGCGGALARAFVAHFHQVSGEPLMLTGRRDLDLKNYIRCDLTVNVAVNELLEKAQPRLIYHFAGGFTGNFAEDVSRNVLATQTLLDVLVEKNLTARVVVMGSAAEYGYVKPEDNPVSETHPQLPVSLYGLAKVMQTQLTDYYVTVKGADIVIARLFNLMAPGLSEKLFAGRVEKQIRQFKLREISQLTFGDLSSQRDYIDAAEAVRQIITIAEKGFSGQAYNVGCGRPQCIRDLLKEILLKEGIGMEVVIENGFKSPVQAGAPQDLIYADIRKIQALQAGFHPLPREQE